MEIKRKNTDTQNIPFIFITAKTERGDLRKGMEMGADDYVTKPFDDIKLLNAIEMRLKKAEVLQQSYAPIDGATQASRTIYTSFITIPTIIKQLPIAPIISCNG
ncbi:MAG: response regulator [Flavisolibacter sp.]|nr:response regulator [Flavisolibacter sp.]